MITKKLTPEREELYEKLGWQIGNTQLYGIKNIEVPNRNKIYAKEEWLNPTSSVFDRLYPWLFQIAEQDGLIFPRITPVIEASTGNAGASFAWSARELGYDDCTVITHADTPKARVEQIQSYGAKIVFSPAGQYAVGYVRELEKILENDKKNKGKLGEDPTRMYCLTKIVQHSIDSPGYQELVDEMLFERLDYFICGVGSGTTISAIGKNLKQDRQIKVIAIEPEYAPVITEFKKGRIANNPERIEMFGLGAWGLPPEKLDIDLSVIDDVMLVSDQDWRKGCQLLKEREGKNVGRSSGAAFQTALRLAEKVSDKNILILFADPAWKYEDSSPYLK